MQKKRPANVCRGEEERKEIDIGASVGQLRHARWRLNCGLDAFEARALAHWGRVGGFRVEERGRGREGRGGGGVGGDRVWSFCVSRRSIAPLSGKEHCPRASLNRRASMSGIANSTQPVAARQAALRATSGVKKRAGLLSRCWWGRGEAALDHHHYHYHYQQQQQQQQPPGMAPQTCVRAGGGNICEHLTDI